MGREERETITSYEGQVDPWREYTGRGALDLACPFCLLADSSMSFRIALPLCSINDPWPGNLGGASSMVRSVLLPTDLNSFRSGFNPWRRYLKVPRLRPARLQAARSLTPARFIASTAMRQYFFARAALTP